MTTVVTVANLRPPGFGHFVDSLRKHGRTPIVLGEFEYGGLGSKPRLLKKAIEHLQIRSEIIIFCDAFDVVFAESPDAIARKFMEFDTEIVWNSERNCFPDASLYGKHPESPTPYRFMNSGFAVGYTRSFLRALTEMKAEEIPNDHRNEAGEQINPNDQDYWMRQLLFGQVPMKLDYRAEICQTLCGVPVDEMDFAGEHVRNHLTGTHPMAFHFNGPAKTEALREPILKKLGLL